MHDAKDALNKIVLEYKSYMDSQGYNYSRFMREIDLILFDLDKDLSIKKSPPSQKKLIDCLIYEIETESIKNGK
jgi:vacuolar-type H+-ATPase subunit C/Vma6